MRQLSSPEAGPEAEGVVGSREAEGLIGSFEPCPTLTGAGSDDPVCAGCGWLDHEHESAPIAEVRTLRTRPRTRRPRRLAS